LLMLSVGELARQRVAVETMPGTCPTPTDATAASCLGREHQQAGAVHMGGELAGKGGQNAPGPSWEREAPHSRTPLIAVNHVNPVKPRRPFRPWTGTHRGACPQLLPSAHCLLPAFPVPRHRAALGAPTTGARISNKTSASTHRVARHEVR
jgi:hypothetical protein